MLHHLDGGLRFTARHEKHPQRSHAAVTKAVTEVALEQRPRDCRQNSAAVDGAERRRRTPVRQPAERGQAMNDNVATGTAAKIGDQADAAAVVFERRVVERKRADAAFRHNASVS